MAQFVQKQPKAMISSSLRTGCPLPQITPCPLLDRFLLQYHGLDVIHKEADEDYGLPRSMTLDTLKDEQYLLVNDLFFFFLQKKIEIIDFFFFLFQKKVCSLWELL